MQLFRECFPGQIDFQVSQGKFAGLTDWVVLNVGKAYEEFGWRPEVDLRSGIQALLHQQYRTMTA
jgi:hypothetical protein